MWPYLRSPLEPSLTVMGLGEGKERTPWPLEWISTVNSMTILGFFVLPNWNEMLNKIWKYLHQRLSEDYEPSLAAVLDFLTACSKEPLFEAEIAGSL